MCCFVFDLTFHGQWHLLQVRHQPPCGDGSACLGSNRCSLANCTGATIEVVVSKCQDCSSELCMLFGPFEARYLHQKRLCKNHSFGTATIHHGLKVVLNRECAEHENEAVKL